MLVSAVCRKYNCSTSIYVHSHLAYIPVMLETFQADSSPDGPLANTQQPLANPSAPNEKRNGHNCTVIHTLLPCVDEDPDKENWEPVLLNSYQMVKK